MIHPTLYSEEAERGVLSSMLIKPALIAETLSELSSEEFVTDRNRRFFQAIKDGYMSGKPVDLVSVLTSLRESGNFKIDDPGCLATLTSMSIIPSLGHAREVGKLARTRVFVQELDQAKTSLLGGQSLDAVVEQFSASFLKTSQKQAKAALLSETIEVDFQTILQRAENGGGLPGLSTGFDDIDRITGGLAPTNLIILAARPAMG